MAFLAIMAVLTLIVGPAFDHHFAERQVSHGHVFLNEVPAEHLHPVDTEHAHGADGRVTVSVVAIGDSDVAGTAIDNVVPPYATRTGDGDDALQLVGIIADEDAPPALTASPPVRPPIA